MFNNVNLNKTAIIGIGSPNDGDKLGWQVIDKLQNDKRISELKKKGLSLFKLDRPGVLLGESIKDYEHVLIIDAIKPGTTTASFIFIDGKQVNSTSSQLSSHETGVIESMGLLKALELLPEELVLIGVSKISDELLEKILELIKIR
ncbi:MAG: hydrogenase maturation protease [Gammaproteobacteria bacterium]|nr:hydrogenase maturation protease [Gammaproteobacteria bacterium]